MYTQTLSRTISKAVKRLFAVKRGDLVFRCTLNALNDAQTEAFAEHSEMYCYDDEDKALALENLFVNHTDDHIYVLEVCDGEDDTPRYYFSDITPQIHLRQNAYGELERR